METAKSTYPGVEFSKLVKSRNIVALLHPEQVKTIGSEVAEGYTRDRGSRASWEERNIDAVNLALQVKEYKNTPWENCSNVKFPLLTIAALQFLARVSTLSQGRSLAKVETLGQDPEGKKSAQAARISTHLSLQLIEEDVNWIDNDEETKLAASILGSAFKKTYYDSVQGIVISEHVPAMNFVVDYYCKDIDTAYRATHEIVMTKNAIQERVRREVFVKMDEDSPAGYGLKNHMQLAADESEGLHPAQDSESADNQFMILEQYCWLDLDDDGYEEPYIVSVRYDTKQVLRIVARFYDSGDVFRVHDGAIQELESQLQEAKDNAKEQSRLEKEIDKLEKSPSNHIIRISPELYFTKFSFIPSPDGGVYGLGLGSLLGPLNESVNSLVNMLIDGGVMSNTAGGFLGRGVKIKAGSATFNPFEWKPIESTGDDLRKNIFPLPVREPSMVLYQLLGMLVQYSEKVSGSTDIMTGVSPGQNTPAETSRNTVEQGMMLFSGIYKRMYRGFKQELRKFCNLNKLYLKRSPKFAELTSGPNAILAADDYISNSFRVFPAASAEAVSTSQRKELEI